MIDPEKRIGAREGAYEELKSHPFFKGIDFSNVHNQTPPTLKPYPTKLVFEDDNIGKEVKGEDREKWYLYFLTHTLIQ